MTYVCCSHKNIEEVKLYIFMFMLYGCNEGWENCCCFFGMFENGNRCFAFEYVAGTHYLKQIVYSTSLVCVTFTVILNV
jgi:hypothetical protein